MAIRSWSYNPFCAFSLLISFFSILQKYSTDLYKSSYIFISFTYTSVGEWKWLTIYDLIKMGLDWISSKSVECFECMQVILDKHSEKPRWGEKHVTMHARCYAMIPSLLCSKKYISLSIWNCPWVNLILPRRMNDGLSWKFMNNPHIITYFGILNS